MPRSAVRVRAASEADLPVLVELAGGLREALVPAVDGSLRPGTPAARAALDQRLRDALASLDRRLVLAVDETDRPLAMALLSVGPCNALVETRAVHVTHLAVDDRHRRRGAGRALVGAAAAFAEEVGVDAVVVSVRPGSREANRFFARLGFAPLAVRRVASVSTVRRRLVQSEPARGIVARRRARAAEHPALAALEPVDADTRS